VPDGGGQERRQNAENGAFGSGGEGAGMPSNPNVIESLTDVERR
jgi:hypothetical protein